MQTLKKNFYLPALDGLRFIAFIIVFIHNSPRTETSWLSMTINKHGWIGVDLFFCLSSFLITKLLLIEYKATGNINVKKFYIRRILRIWPLYYLFISLVAIYLISQNETDGRFLESVVRTATFTENLFAAFLSYNHIPYLIHLWTISFEEQFYLVIPFLGIWLFKMKKNEAIAALLSILIGSTIIRVVLIITQAPFPSIEVLPITRLESLLGGIILGLGIFDTQLKKHKNWKLLLLSLACLLTVLFLPSTREVGWNLLITYPLVGIGMALLVFLAVNQEGSAQKFLGNSFIVHLGKISYGLYIFHIPSFYMAFVVCQKIGVVSQQTSVYQPVMLLIGFVITYLLALASYNLIEHPLLQLRKKYSFINSHPEM